MIRDSSLALIVVLSVAAPAAAQPAPRPRVQETAPAKRVMNDPAVNPKSSTPHPGLPAGALVDDGRGEREERREGWAVARWTVHTLRLPSSAKRSISIAAPSVLLIRASWPDASDLTISVTKGGASLASIKGTSAGAGGRLATGYVTIPSAGELVVAASGGSAGTVTLHVGVLPKR